VSHPASQFKQWVMEPRRDWNAMGPKLPAWFRLRLARVDPNLVLQFMPPRTIAKGGVQPDRFPKGVWAICRRMKGTRMLFKRWVWSMSDEFGIQQLPGTDTINMIRFARDMWRQGKSDLLEKRLDESIASIKRARTDTSRDMLRDYVGKICSKYDDVFGHNHVFIRDSPLARA